MKHLIVTFVLVVGLFVLSAGSAASAVKPDPWSWGKKPAKVYVGNPWSWARGSH